MKIIATQFLRLFMLLSLSIAPILPAKTDSPVIVVYMDNYYFKSIGGYPPENRNAYLPLLTEIKKFKPRVIYMDFKFVRPPLASEKSFALKANAEIPIIFPFMFSAEKYEENYNENLKFFGSRIPARKVSDETLPFSMLGIILPYPELVEHSEQVCAYDMDAEDGRKVEYFYLNFFYDKFFFSATPLCIMNSYLRNIDRNLILSRDMKSLYFTKQNGKKATESKKLGESLSSRPEFKLKIQYRRIQKVSALDILNKKVRLPEDKIILLGSSADGVTSRVNTPLGVLTDTDVLAHEVDTLWAITQ